MTKSHKVFEIFPEESQIPEKYRLNTRIEQKIFLVNGESRKWDGPVQEVFSPVCIRKHDTVEQKYIGSYPLLTQKESLEILNSAIKAYSNGYGEWPTMSVEERIRHVELFVEKMRKKRDEVVALLMWEIGKTLKDSEKEFDRTIDYIIDTIEALKVIDRNSSRFVIESGIIAQIRQAPLGVVLCMGPFNYPLNETFATLIPALITGNAVIFKPPKLGVLLHYPLLEAFQQSFPKGVVNTVYGAGQKVVAPLMSSGNIDVLAFIGSSRVADILKSQHPKPHRLKCILGLEAKNAGIILDDAELESTVQESVVGTLSYNGQRCTALKILFVHQSIASKFINKFCEAVDRLNFGMPWEDNVNITPLPEKDKPAYLQSLVDDALNLGAGIVNNYGGSINKTFFSPAVLYPVTPQMKIYSKEQFGPVIPIVPFEDIDEPLSYIRDSDYGQQVSIFGQDPDIIAKLIDPLVNQVCRVNVNSQCQRGPDTFPFTGRKDSAEGTLSVSDALGVFSIRTLVAAKQTEMNKRIISTIVRERSSKFLSTDFIL
ncbi:MAG: NADP-dependent glyceraldehyde-3-phosphate dehydrogenase [Deltaproteobacteria bacterium]|nr:NADP-dependent glyceraldehyde-3-phosphate dehydrogenase [Deltaproteobacteria bacterium]MBW2018905.1 NADP-dependent glyceraldehyde-3-phosphate dehydrogenase [Deltaproteobacteria bacterium]MBW2073660.1 NADP-dependent glyceraldehyde-3-phosphate dehydrogenase [Deltaproteobacteria bacterium]